jgi:hypothetical protein
MSKQVKTKAETKEEKSGGLVFGRMNYLLLIVGLVVIIIGFLLMSGGGSDDPNVFDEGIFSFRRITLAPIVVLIGFIIEGVAIMYRPKPPKE